MVKEYYVLLLLILFLTFIKEAQCFPQTSPIWSTSQYFRAGNQYIIDSYTGSSQTPTYTFYFSSAVTGIPYLAYGIKNYEGDDYLGVQQFQVRRQILTQTSYTVAVQIFGSTYIWRMGVAYIAIDPSFPHRLNSYDGVPLNYSNGDLVNVTTKNPTQITYYSNTINFTQQAGGSSFNSFNTPLEKNKILLFMMALNIWSTNQGSSTTWYPVTLKVDVEVISTQTYQLSFELSYNVYIGLLHFSMIIFDTEDIKSSQKYVITYQKIDYPIQGGFYPFQIQFTDNFIMGLIDFGGQRGQMILHYNWELGYVNGEYGAIIEYSIPNNWQSRGIYALTRQGTNVFYLKTFQCPENMSFFNQTSDKCQLCPSYELIYLEACMNTTCDDQFCAVCSANANVCEECGDYYIMYGGVCILYECGRQKCAICNQSYGICDDCGDGFLLYLGSCIQSVCHDPYCAICSINAHQCEACADDYILFQGSCILSPCALPNCAVCTQDIGICETCADGYVLYRGYCIKATCDDQNCAICTANVRNCQTCADNYLLYKNSCIPSKCEDSSCAVCKDEGKTCSACIDAYLLYRSSCVFSSCPGSHCIFCEENPKVCETCADGYQLQMGQCVSEICVKSYCNQCPENRNICYEVALIFLCIFGFFLISCCVYCFICGAKRRSEEEQSQKETDSRNEILQNASMKEETIQDIGSEDLGQQKEGQRKNLRKNGINVKEDLMKEGSKKRINIQK